MCVLRRETTIRPVGWTCQTQFVPSASGVLGPQASPGWVDVINCQFPRGRFFLFSVAAGLNVALVAQLVEAMS